ncbi:two-component system histidine kinase PnpS [Jeotgalibacillus soli]|uniref:histidine kinase n=1 Tax=Jeotgalibacillus soli TaxID=889306 RepID=A0A0C2VIH8_9BACL|nr:ATP-binding protein [Jeotgalibacillus soli]KIL43813.1 alkaline phosphatase [Jeotgalibacillus soli]
MTSFRSRLLFALISLIAIVLVGLGVLLGELFKSYYLNTLHSRLEKEVAIVANQVETLPSFRSINELLLNETSNILDVRISILSDDGSTIFENDDVNHDEEYEQVMSTLLSEYLQHGKAKTRYQGEGNRMYYSYPVSAGSSSGIIVLSTEYTELENVHQQIWLILSISLGLALVIIILLGYRITSRYTRPIESATKVAIELAKGNYRARTFEDRVDETGMLSNAINVLARNLQEMVAHQEIQRDRLQTLIENMGSGLVMIDKQGYIVLVNRTYHEFFYQEEEKILNRRYMDVFQEKKIRMIAEEVFMTERRVRKQLHLSINQEKRHLDVYGAPIIGEGSAWQGIVLVFHDITELKKLEQMRKDFVANVSHEVKTPITSIKGFSETLLDGAMHDQEALESFLRIILTESDRLQALIQDLLDLSKVEQQGFQLQLAKMDMKQLLEDVIVMVEQKAAQKEMKISLNGSDASFLEGDYNRLKQVFINLMSNGITYSQPGGELRIVLEDTPQETRVKIEDDGIGMEETEIPRIFERFYRIDKARSRNSGGTGLGLAIVKHIIEVHHGEVQVQSSVNEGTTFTIILPKKHLDRM